MPTLVLTQQRSSKDLWADAGTSTGTGSVTVKPATGTKSKPKTHQQTIDDKVKARKAAIDAIFNKLKKPKKKVKVEVVK